MKKLIRVKFYDWRYEKEWRLFVNLQGDVVREGGTYFYKFSQDLKLCEVILGPRCELPINDVRRIVSNFKPKVIVIKARIAHKSFRILKHINASRESMNI